MCDREGYQSWRQAVTLGLPAMLYMGGRGVIVKFSLRFCIDLTGVPDRGACTSCGPLDPLASAAPADRKTNRMTWSLRKAPFWRGIISRFNKTTAIWWRDRKTPGPILNGFRLRLLSMLMQLIMKVMLYDELHHVIRTCADAVESTSFQ